MAHSASCTQPNLTSVGEFSADFSVCACRGGVIFTAVNASSPRLCLGGGLDGNHEGQGLVVHGLSSHGVRWPPFGCLTVTSARSLEAF